jgi:hypothetical protein
VPDLDPRQRDKLAADVVNSLERALLGSVPTLRGSLAFGGADEYSDIDILWQVQEGSLMLALEALPRALETVRPMESLRVDPSSKASPTRRLVFARLAEVPLFWRLDIEIVEPTALEDRPQLPQHGEEVDDPDWSPTESALMNAVAAAKARLRGDPDGARELLDRAWRRVGLQPAGRADLLPLIDAIEAMDSRVRPLAARVRELVGSADLS